MAKIHYNAGTWTPKLVSNFLKDHRFIKEKKYNGDDCLWRGKKPNGDDAQVAYPVRRVQLTPATMRTSVVKPSGYSKKHWDLWRSLGKTDRKRCKCCEDG